MAKEQILVHLHTSEGELSAITREVRLGEIIVRHKNVRPELYTKKDDGTYATFIDSVAVDAKISAATTTVNTSIDNLSKDVKALSAATEAGFAAASTYTDGQVANAVASAQTFATTAKADAVASGKGYTDAVVAAEKAALQGEISSATKNLQDAIDGVEDKVDELSGSVETMKEDLQNAIASAVTKAYIYRGSKQTYEELPTEGNVEGDVWNVVEPYGNYPGGTYWAWDGEKWDALGGIVDLTIYATSADTHAAIQTVQTNVDNLGKDVKALSAATEAGFAAASADTVAALADAKSYADSAATAAKADAVASGKGYTDAVVAAAKEAIKETTDALNNKFNNYATSAATEAAIAKAKEEAVASGKGYTDVVVADHKKDVDTVISAFSASVVTEFAAVKKTTDDLDTRIDDLEAISDATQSAVQEIAIAGIEGVSTKKEGTKVTIDFTKAVIDCGEF